MTVTVSDGVLSDADITDARFTDNKKICHLDICNSKDTGEEIQEKIRKMTFNYEVI